MRLAADGTVQMIGINYKDRPAAALQWLKELGDPFDRIGRDVDGRASIDWGVYGIPETFVVDSDGVIRFKHVGPLTAEVVNRDIAPLLARLSP